MDDKEITRSQAVESAVNDWHAKSVDNVEKWGLQGLGTLVLATQEELGETAEVCASAADADVLQLEVLLDQVVWAGVGIQHAHEELYEDVGGNPVDNPPSFHIDFDEVDIDQLEEELSDTAALLIQMQAAIERQRGDS